MSNWAALVPPFLIMKVGKDGVAQYHSLGTPKQLHIAQILDKALHANGEEMTVNYRMKSILQAKARVRSTSKCSMKFKTTRDQCAFSNQVSRQPKSRSMHTNFYRLTL